MGFKLSNGQIHINHFWNACFLCGEWYSVSLVNIGDRKYFRQKNSRILKVVHLNNSIVSIFIRDYLR